MVRLNLTNKINPQDLAALKQTLTENIENFPTIKNIITLKKLLELADKNPHGHFVHYLSKSNPNPSKITELLNVIKRSQDGAAIFCLGMLIEPYCIMNYLDKFLESIKDEEKLGKYISHLTEPNSFWQGYSEIEVAANIKNVFGKIELEPKLPNGKSVDVKFQLDYKDIFVEITAPKTSKKYLEEMEKSAETGQVVELPIPIERASEKIVDEIKHFSQILGDVHSVIIINLNDTDIEDCDIDDAMLGESSLLVQTNKQTGEVKTSVIRKKWSAFNRDPDLEKIGAVICYKRGFNIKGEIKYEKKMFVMSFDNEKYEPLTKLFY